MASKFMLCSFMTCPWVQRAAIVLRAKNVAYDITYIDRDNRPAWFLAISPHAKVPVLLVKDIPPVSSAAEIRITRPEIYYGKLSSSHVIVNTKSKEFDYPAGEENVYTSYAGTGGVPAR